MNMESKKTDVDSDLTSKEKKSPENYSFEKKWWWDNFSWLFILTRLIRWNRVKDRTLLIERLAIRPSDVQSDILLSKAIDSYLNQCLRNIFYYRRKIIQENIMRKAYGLFTLLIVTCVPLFIFLYTDKAVGGILPKEYNFLQNSQDEETPNKGKIRTTHSSTLKDSSVKNGETPIICGAHVDRVVKNTSPNNSDIFHLAVQFDSSAIDPGPRTADIIKAPTSKIPKSGKQDNPNETRVNPETVTNEVPVVTEKKKPMEKTATNNQEESLKSGESDRSKLDGLEAVGIIISLLLTSLFAVHQVISQWTGKRKFRAHFHQTQTDLMNIHFELEALAQSNFSLGDPENYDFEGLKEALHSATNRCRVLVREETRKYFELSASPAVELGGIFSSSMTTANSLVNAFSSKKYSSELERLRSSVKEYETAQKNLDVELQKSIIEEKTAVLKLKKLLDRQDRLEEELAELEILNKAQDKDRMKLLSERLKSLEEQIDDLEIVIEDAQEKVALKRFEILQHQ